MFNLNKAYSWAISTCNAPDVGYSQIYRNQQTINGITFYDCSSFIWYALKAGGLELTGWPFTTYNMGGILIQNGWTSVPTSGEWLPGDIGVSTAHTEMVYRGGLGYGVCMGAHTNNAILANQVSIGSSSGNPDYISDSSRFPLLYRYGDGGAVGYGYSIYVVAALCGNAWRESNINPGLNQVGGTAFGLFQWDGSRKTNLLNWLNEKGYEKDSPEGQMLFLIEENDWQGSFGGISSLTEFLESTSTDVAMLTEAFMRCWERPGVPELAERIEHAKQCLKFISEHAQDSTIKNWVIKDGYLTEDEILNNAVMMYRFYASGGGGGGTLGKKIRKMPVWMYIKYIR